VITLERLKMRNFLSHENTELEFPPGVTVILGRNGAGKTAIMDAVIHALLGFDERIRGRTADDLIRRGSNSMEIELTFKVDGNEFTVRRRRERGGRAESTLVRTNMGVLARTSIDVNREILNLLNADKETLRHAIFIRQGEITRLIEEDPAERKRLIGKMIGLEKLEKAWQNMNDVLKFLRDREDGIERELGKKEGELGRLMQQLKDQTEEVERLEAEVEEKEQEFNKLQQEFEQIRKVKDALEEKERALEGIMNSFQEFILSVKQVLSTWQRLSEVWLKLREVLPEPTRQAYLDKVREIDGKYNEIEKQIAEYQNRRADLKGQIGYLEQSLGFLGESEECPVCKTRLSPEQKNKVMHDLLQSINSSKSTLQQVENSLRKLETQKKELERVKESLQQAQPYLEQAEKLLKELEKLKEKVKETSNKLLGVLTEFSSGSEEELQKLREIEGLLKSLGSDIEHLREKPEYNLSRVEEELSRLEDTIKEVIEYSRKRYGDVKNKYESTSKELSKLEGELKEKKKQLSTLKEKLERVESDRKSLEGEKRRLEEEKKKIEDMLSKLEVIREAFSKDGVQKMLRQRFAPYVSELSTRYVERFNLDITGILVDEDFNVVALRGGDSVPISLLSGGEKVAVAIALRLAIAGALAEGVSTVMMDEPTAFLDEERRKLLIDVFRSFFRERAPVQQMIIITHERELEEVADTLYLVENVNGVSMVKEQTSS